ncbi:MAG: carboxypeptidase-like regulatory domain-containing protein, partial [Planctomycetota bacterium]
GFAPQVESDGDGRFRFEGLVDRPYTIEATHPKTMARAAPLTVAAGTNDAVLRLPGPEAVFSRVRGRVVDSEGNPVPDVRLTLATDTAQVRYRGHVFSTRHGRRDDRVTTGEDGHFEFRDVPRRAVYLRLDGPRVVSRDWGRDTFALEEWLDDPLDVVLEVGLRRRFQVHLADPARADALSVLDSDGNPLSISLIMGNSRRDGPRMQIEGGKTGVLTVADTASMLVLYRGQQEVERLPIELGDSDVETLDL